MTYVPLPNIACVVGLIAGATLILGADFARAAETRPCTEEEAAPFQDESGLPVICTVMTVTAKRIDQSVPRVAQFNYRDLYEASELKEGIVRQVAATSWRPVLTN